MNTIQKIIVGICIVSVPFVSSCGKDDPDPCNWGTELQAEVNAYVAAYTAYSQDQSPANCLAYKNSLIAYLNAAEDIEDCVPDNQQAEFEASLDAAQIEADLLAC